MCEHVSLPVLTWQTLNIFLQVSSSQNDLFYNFNFSWEGLASKQAKTKHTSEKNKMDSLTEEGKLRYVSS